MSALPGTPAIQHAIPMQFFGTTAFAAPGLGIVASVIMLSLGLAWLSRRASSARTAGEGYGSHADVLPKCDVVMREHAQSEGFDINELSGSLTPKENPPPFWLALLPIIVVIVSNLVFIEIVLPRMDTLFLAKPLFGETTVESVRGVWAVIVGLFLAILLLIGGNWQRLTELRASLDKGADASVLPIFNTASLVGFGAVIAALPVFHVISQAAMSMGGGNPLVSVAGSVGLLSAMTGSASGGMSIALDALGPTFVDLARETGVSLEAMHRVTAVASGSLDALPHNGAVITLLVVCQLSHRESYLDVFMTSIVGPMISLVVIILLATFIGSF
jgi:H+/gluconate symporter-like permease